MKELADLLLDIEDYIAWIKQVDIQSAEENIRRLLAGVLDYDPAEEIVPVKITDAQPVKTDPTVKFLMVSGESPINQEKLKHAGWLALGYGSNLFFYTTGREIKVVNVEVEEGKLELEVMMEFDLTKDDPTEVATTLWPLCKKDCGKKVLVVNMTKTTKEVSP
jgi:hypothetical protein